ncbi:MAG: murein biosynthesis integral membrane protein MurJ [Candidatus Azambacteria bacterium]|nr:murein biosynthesis integral membrane protein MurJ [Candidatus Azambacteria bacterium]
MIKISMFLFLDRFINQKSQKISSAALIIAFFGLVSRFLGLWRDRLMAGQFGAGKTLDIYYAAFRIPDLVYNLLIIGAISSAFLPIFYEYSTKNKKEAWEFSANVLNILIFALLIFSAFLILFTPQLMFLVAPGFDSASKALATDVSRLLFLSPLLLGVSALVTALLQAFSKFLIAALAPVFYNLGIILGIVFLAPHYGIWGLAFGVIIGALVHLLIQIPSLLNIGFRFRGFFNFKDQGLVKMAKLWLPRTFGLFALQINSIVSTAVASILASGSITIFNFADNLRWVPIGIVGVAFSTAAFPAMSLAYAQGKRDLFSQRFSLAVRQALFIVAPLSVLFFILRNQIVKIILGAGNFNWQNVQLTAAILGLFAFGIFAASLLPLFTRAFFAFHNTKTPVFINVFSMLINIVLSFIFVGLLIKFPFLSQKLGNIMGISNVGNIAILGLPLAVTVASIINIIWHWFDLKKCIGDFGVREIKKSCVKIIIATGASAGFIYMVSISNLGVLFQTFFAALVGGMVYLLVAFALGMEEILMLNIPATLLNWRGIKNPEPELTGESLDDQF